MPVVAPVERRMPVVRQLEVIGARQHVLRVVGKRALDVVEGEAGEARSGGGVEGDHRATCQRDASARRVTPYATAKSRKATAMEVFVTGGTGYVGRAVVPALLRRGHHVSVLTRAASRARVSPGAIAI